MGVRHRELPIEAVQFHPESILTLEGDCGLRLMENMIEAFAHTPVALELLSSNPSVAVVGGGLAGLAPPLALGSAGYPVTVFEARPFLGGRATSYPLNTADETRHDRQLPARAACAAAQT